MQENRLLALLAKLKPAWIQGVLALLALGLSFWSFGGPTQGQMEQRDRWRISDLRILKNDLRECSALTGVRDLPATFEPLSCARNPQKLTAYASEITYERLDEHYFQLCIEVEYPDAISSYDMTLGGNLACNSDKPRGH